MNKTAAKVWPSDSVLALIFCFLSGLMVTLALNKAFGGFAVIFGLLAVNSDIAA